VVTDQQPKEQMLELHELEHDTATQSRAAIDPDTVERYGELMRDGHKFDPIIVFYDGVRYWRADGWHRSAGAEWAGKKSIACLIYQGSKEDAILYACRANSQHGKTMTNADKRKCVELVLKLKGDWSDRAIADHVGVTHPFVAKVRGEVVTVTTSTGTSLSEQFEKRIARDGSMRPATQPVRDAQPTAVTTTAPPVEDDDSDPMLDMLIEPYDEILGHIRKALSGSKDLSEDPEQGIWFRDKIARITTDLQAASGAINALKPAQYCEPCNGQGCQRCRYSGYLTRAYVQQQTEK
jgi:hypothetical protein